ncbi:hypothetical protein C7S18_11355 [Ahniella affigens]|uniref:Helicase ATP-binding domain-containing protein n=1 Tax=Ahniella affigens TaxID=2021234 RepID=A0A2P1PSD5_9GAMM|nr:DEAD/DEAH box helicase [Ahniella affigens]AVP97757.1 hypothetical protein C7S18_11355 [Ahniella affigens]
MPVTEWGTLDPKRVGGWINFRRDQPDWQYASDGAASMASRQAEGVAYLWNLLAQQGVALLADEVGMGKTFQALGVAALLWKMKPDARVLVMAPNRDICAHWRREFQAFVEFHYRPVDHCVKNGVDGGPVPAVHTLTRLEDLVAAVEQGAGHLYLTTIHSLSGLVPDGQKGQDSAAVARNNAQALHQRIKAALGPDGFDLIIIDEAHYFRNRSGGSQRVAAAEAWFGSAASRLSQKTLLLTATPSHSRLEDIHSIVSYFRTPDPETAKTPMALMKAFGLRRLRRMQGNAGHFSKHQYRTEQGMPCDFDQRPESELFFALYQKMLVTRLKITRESKSLLYGFLEGFESVGCAPIEQDGASDPEASAKADTEFDFDKAGDTDLLNYLTGKYSAAFGHLPDHPKYGQLVARCVPTDLFTAPKDLFDDKHLVFVRRIPSVRELTQRINSAYDDLLAARIYRAFGLTEDSPLVKNWRDGKPKWSRSGFDELVRQCEVGGSEPEDDDSQDDAQDAVEDADAYLGSTIADLFVVKKGRGNRNDAIKVSQRFKRATSAFAMFLEPALDYKNKPYEKFYEYKENGRARADFVTSAKDQRFNILKPLANTKRKSNRNYEAANYDAPVRTVWALVYPELSPDQRKKLDSWADDRKDIAENFANYLKSGFLFASPVMVELYAWYKEFSRDNQEGGVQQRYLAFWAFAEQRIKTSLLLAYFKAALDTFEILCEKIVDHPLGAWEKEWTVLTSLQSPAWYASGQSKNRQRLILGFNSPFYPNVLVATSVFQEGVNLHVQCRKVHHYGIAGSPGANEQRVGRVDRLFGRVNELLKQQGKAELQIAYPFLQGSVDEDQVASFIARKYDVEERMDSCKPLHFDNTVELTREDWSRFLRTPDRVTLSEDPYPAQFDPPNSDGLSYEPIVAHDNDEIDAHVAALFEGIVNSAVGTLHKVEKNLHNPNARFLIDSVLTRDGGQRTQPILVEQHFSAPFSALVSGTVYALTLTSPIASKADLASRKLAIQSNVETKWAPIRQTAPLVRLAVNEAAANSHFYLYLRVDLPIFTCKGKLSHLSSAELSLCFQQLQQCADAFESALFADDRDLGLAALPVQPFLQKPAVGSVAPGDRTSIAPLGPLWTRLSSVSDGVVQMVASANLATLRQRFLDEDVPADSFAAVLALNHELPFLDFWPDSGGQVQVCASYPSADMQADEQHLLERWLDYVLSDCRS